MSDYTFHNVLDKAKIADYVDLFSRAYGTNEKLTATYLQWLYEENPDGRAVGVDAYKGEELAAHYVTVPRRYLIDGQEVLGLLSLNTATHPDHQRRGLFKKLANATYERGAGMGFSFVIGVANAQSVHGFINGLGFESPGQVRLAPLQRPLPPSNDSPHLAPRADWLRWRLSNPSANFFMTSARNDRRIVYAKRGYLNFALGNLPSGLIEESGLHLRHQAFSGLASLTPVFPSEGRILLPLRLQPSPWHVILRPLNGSIASMRSVHIDGLAMDTF